MQAPTTAVDARRLERVFRNLFENAFDACGDDAEVSICFEANEEGFSIKVLDNGPGMPAEVRARIFDAFYTTKPTGTGLGMAIVYRIVEAHGGTIEVTDRSPGTEFVIRLPRSAR